MNFGGLLGAIFELRLDSCYVSCCNKLLKLDFARLVPVAKNKITKYGTENLHTTCYSMFEMLSKLYSSTTVKCHFECSSTLPAA